MAGWLQGGLFMCHLVRSSTTWLLPFTLFSPPTARQADQAAQTFTMLSGCVCVVRPERFVKGTAGLLSQTVIAERADRLQMLLIESVKSQV